MIFELTFIHGIVYGYVVGLLTLHFIHQYWDRQLQKKLKESFRVET